MSAQHTPGPWAVIGAQGSAIWADAEIIAQSTFARSAPRVAHANAVLMAAAPDMLAALQKIAPELHGLALLNHLAGELSAVVDAAIAKATGEQP